MPTRDEMLRWGRGEAIAGMPANVEAAKPPTFEASWVPVTPKSTKEGIEKLMREGSRVMREGLLSMSTAFDLASTALAAFPGDVPRESIFFDGGPFRGE